MWDLYYSTIIILISEETQGNVDLQHNWKCSLRLINRSKSEISIFPARENPIYNYYSALNSNIIKRRKKRKWRLHDSFLHTWKQQDKKFRLVQKHNKTWLGLPHPRKDVMALLQALKHLLLEISNPFQGIWDMADSHPLPTQSDRKW